jgi:serine/threonine protein phosphatase PrpC
MDYQMEMMSDDIREYIMDEINSNKEIKSISNSKIPIIHTKSYDIESCRDVINKYQYGLALTQGRNINMEDKYIIESFLDNPLFIILDGHNGSYVSEYCKKNLMRILYKLNEEMDHSNSNIVNNFTVLFQKLIIKLEKELEQYSMEHNSGSTITVVYILTNYVITVNLGDSKALMVLNNFQYKELSMEHKPYNPIEKRRITEAKGNIINNKLNNDLDISRSLGDFRYKSQKVLTIENQLVSNIPNINIYNRDKSEQYIILSSNGIWDFLTNQKLIDFINKLHKNKINNIGEISKKIIKQSIENGNIGNTTLIMIKL